MELSIHERIVAYIIAIVLAGFYIYFADNVSPSGMASVYTLLVVVVLYALHLEVYRQFKEDTWRTRRERMTIHVLGYLYCMIYPTIWIVAGIMYWAHSIPSWYCFPGAFVVTGLVVYLSLLVDARVNKEA